jgi:hypothetical protein
MLWDARRIDFPIGFEKAKAPQREGNRTPPSDSCAVSRRRQIRASQGITLSGLSRGARGPRSGMIAWRNSLISVRQSEAQCPLELTEDGELWQHSGSQRSGPPDRRP